MNEILKDIPETRDNDFLLTMWVYVKLKHAKRQPLGILIKYEGIEEAPAFETITRIRREIQNKENRYQASEKVQENRSKREIEYREKHSKRVNVNSFPNSHLM